MKYRQHLKYACGSMPLIICLASMAHAPPEIQPPDLSVLPDQVVDAYTSLDSLSMKGTLLESGVRPDGEDYPERVRAIVEFSTAKGGRHRSIASVDGQWVWTRVGDGHRFTERDVKGRFHVGDLPFGNAVLNPVPGCQFGAYLSGWLDEDQIMLRAFHRIASNGAYMGLEESDDHACWKVHYDMGDASQTLYVDVRTRLIRRFIGEQVFEVDDDGKPTSWLRRDYRFSDIKVNGVDPSVFVIARTDAAGTDGETLRHDESGPSTRPADEREN